MLAADHRWARGVLQGAWPLVTPEPPTTPELQLIGAVAAHEGRYGKGFEQHGTYLDALPKNNWGAIVCAGHLLPPCPEGCFLWRDSSPGKGYEERCFQGYPTPEAGAAAVVRLLTVKRPAAWAAARAGDTDAFAAAMYHTGYYEGWTHDPATNISQYAGALQPLVREIAAANGEPVAAFRSGETPGPGPGLPPAEPTFASAGGVLLPFALGFLAGHVGVLLVQHGARRWA